MSGKRSSFVKTPGTRQLYQPPPAIFLAAVLTNSVDLEGMASGCVMVFAANLLFQTVDFRRKEFHRTAAFGTDHVMVTAPVVLVLVARDAIVESHFAGQSAFGEHFQRA